MRAIISRSVEMEDTEKVLQRATVASITGTCPVVFADEVVDVLYTTLELQPGDFSVHLHQPEDFLILCSSQAIKDRISGDHFIRGSQLHTLPQAMVQTRPCR